MPDVRAIARALGGEVNSGAVSAPGPGHSKHDRSMRVFLDAGAPGGFRVQSFAGDDWRACRDEVNARLGGISLPAEPRPSRTAELDRNNRIALELWSKSQSLHATPAEVYLITRALIPPFPDDLRFHPQCPFRLDNRELVKLPTMIALFRDIHNNERCGIHRTALKPDGSAKSGLPGLGPCQTNARAGEGLCHQTRL